MTEGATPDRTRPAAREERERVLRFQSLSPGAVFAGRYEIRDVLGAGGSGEVFRAFDQLAGAEVALKVLFPGTSDRDLVRLRREVRVVRELHHPGILRVHDLGEHDGLFFTVSELLRGDSLAQRLARESSLKPDEAEAILVGILEALAFAHEAGIIHRDVKPANVFLARDEGSDPPRVVLLDFGLARPFAEPGVTATGVAVGTPTYCAPEQIRGERNIGPASDLYGCGVTLWEMLSGKPPFEGTSEVDVLNQHLSAPLPPASRKLKGAPLRLRALAESLLEKDPRRRPRSARAALLRLGGADTLVGRSALTLQAIRRLLARRWARFAALVLALLIATAWLLTPTDAYLDAGVLMWRARCGLSIPSRVKSGRFLSVAFGSNYWILGAEALGVLRPNRDEKGWLRVPGAQDPPVVRVSWPWGVVNPALDSEAQKLSTAAADYPLFGSSMSQGWVAPLKTSHGTNSGRFIVTSSHPHSYPTRLMFVNPHGAFEETYLHPGRVFRIAPIENGPDRGPIVVVSAFNNLLGPRAVVFGLSDPQQTGFFRAQGPPYTASVRLDRIEGYYLPLPATGGMTENPLTIQGRVGTIVLGSAMTVRFDVDSGVPLDLAMLGGLTASAWASRRDALLEGLITAQGRAEAGASAEGAEILERFAENGGGSPPLLSIPLYRAAILRMAQVERDGPAALERALTDITSALTFEPDASRYRLLHAEILARMGRRDEALRALAVWWSKQNLYMYSYEWLLVNWLAGNEPNPDTALGRMPKEPPDSWRIHIDMSGALRRGDFERAIVPITAIHDGNDWSLFWYLGAEAVLNRPKPDPKLALHYLDMGDKCTLDGNPIPLFLARLRAHIAADPHWRPDASAIRAATNDLDVVLRQSFTSIETLFVLELASGDAEAVVATGLKDPGLESALKRARNAAPLRRFSFTWLGRKAENRKGERSDR